MAAAAKTKKFDAVEGDPPKGRTDHPQDSGGPEPKRTGTRDAAPRKTTRKSAGTKKAATTKAIEDALLEVLQLPAVPCALIGDDWAARHFGNDEGASAKLAHEIAVASERNDTLRKWCERFVEGEALGVLLIATFMYAYPPLLHWGIVPGPAGMLGVPVVGRESEPEDREPPYESMDDGRGTDGAAATAQRVPGTPDTGVSGTAHGTAHPSADTQ